jgi:hypothetical protein
MVGDLYMSLIETCRFCSVNPFEYLPAVQKHARLVSENPQQWLPVRALDVGWEDYLDNVGRGG